MGLRGVSGEGSQESWGRLCELPGEVRKKVARRMRYIIGLEATWAVLEPPCGSLEAVWGLSWAPFGSPWASLGVLWGLLGAVLRPCMGHLGHLKYAKLNSRKHSKTLIRIAFLGPRESQDGPKLGQVGVKLRS